MPALQFTAYNALGGSLWVVVFSLLGYAFGRNLPRLVHYIGRVSLLLATLIAVVVVIVFLWRWFKRHRVEVVASVEQSLERVTESPRLAEMRTRHPVAGRLLFGHYAHGEYLALHLFTGFLLSLAVIGIFGSITEGVIDTSPLTRFDVAIAARLNQSAPEAMLRAFAVLSSLGGRGAMTLLLFAGALHYAVRRRGLELAGWCAAFIGGSLLDATLKFVVRRSELPFADVVLIDWGTGLASGHVLGVVVGFGMLAYLAVSLTRRGSLQTLIVFLAVALVIAITVSRLYLGQAYVSDASAGLAAGLLWLAACVSAIEIVRQNRAERVLAPAPS
jgi:undecaprenyl-diphosphatase